MTSKKIINILSHCNFLYTIMNLFRILYYESRYQRFRKKYKLHQTFKFNGVDIEFHGNGEIIIDENSYIGNRSAFSAVKGCKIIVGKNCAISHNVRIYTSNRNPNDIINQNKIISEIKGDVSIGDNVWIGANAYINQGVTIGNNVVIGANSVITKNIGSNCIVVGSNRITKTINR